MIGYLHSCQKALSSINHFHRFGSMENKLVCRYTANDFVPVSFHPDFNSLPAIGGNLVNCALRIPRIRSMIFWANASDLNFNMYIKHGAERNIDTWQIARSDWRASARKYQQSNLADSPTSNYHSAASEIRDGKLTRTCQVFRNLRWPDIWSPGVISTNIRIFLKYCKHKIS